MSKKKGEDEHEDEAKDWGASSPSSDYMRWEVIVYLYSELTGDAFDNPVDVLWNCILHAYFRLEQNYLIGALGDPGEMSDIGADLAVRCVRHTDGVTQTSKLVLIGNSRISDESSYSAWSAATERLLDYLKQARVENASSNEAIYGGIVSVGHYSRYYTLFPGMDTLSCFSSRRMEYIGAPLHFKEDEYSMHTLLEELLEVTSNGILGSQAGAVFPRHDSVELVATYRRVFALFHLLC
ncbi:uncharacterized protein F5Z01DRAFT_753114 [Emericellopsis atlantica]|uniref:Uncharacterized protein n=1 Tax=Emericellopsis atlantica TaxID=2614577 RepID=A0A9P7ZFQ1_9HYPO|nr:uncharacterized protein F5Z01DRAFT_753114 [Emericellopsis atlantica]KAG9250972.1 hypothetical protein F5Z01DRAFT_753114 [Emericellopsis atlantica]